MQITTRYKNDLTKLLKWSEKCQVLFNLGKCKFIHIGHGNVNKEYTILGIIVKEKHLGVTVSADMTVSEQCEIVALLQRATKYWG